ncbi:hypothetical protein OG501_21665 [Streptomyces niveus]
MIARTSTRIARTASAGLDREHRETWAGLSGSNVSYTTRSHQKAVTGGPG